MIYKVTVSSTYTTENSVIPPETITENRTCVNLTECQAWANYWFRRARTPEVGGERVDKTVFEFEHRVRRDRH